MGLKAGIVGLPNVGKSTLFNSLSSAKAQSANYPFCTIEPNLGVITVPDPRLNKISELVNPQNVVPNTIEIVDIAGLVKGASKGEGLGNQFLANIRDTNAILHVVRCFEDENITHVDGSVNPVRDKEVIDFELQLKDLETVDTRVAKVQKKASIGDKESKREYDSLVKLKTALEAGKSARTVQALNEDELAYYNSLHLLTRKPVLYIANVDEDGVENGNKHVQALDEAVKEEGAQILLVCAKIESEIAEIEDAGERQELLEMYGLTEPGVNKIIRGAYELLDLLTFFTAGEKEVRAWPYKKGSKAPQTAGVIHTDFEHGFIKAEVIGYDEFVALGGEQAAKEKGRLRIEGKEYVVQDGDVMHFRFNV